MRIGGRTFRINEKSGAKYNWVLERRLISKYGGMRMKPFFISAFVALTVAGCSTIGNLSPFSKGNDLKANQEIKAKWSGKPVDEFFAKLGKPANQLTNSSGQLVYVWSKQEGTSTTAYFCDLRIIANSRGNITEIEITAVSTGKTHSNYCDDISW